jgi:hypothetical protein
MANSGKTIMVQGRIVWTSGDLFKGRPKLDMNTKQQKVDRQGQPITEYGFGLAVPKQNIAEIWAASHEEAFTIFPSRQLPPDFAMKYKDGDAGVDQKGISYSQRPGYAGCLVYAMTTTLPIKFFRWENGQNILISDGIKCGDYVNVQVNIKAHGAVGTSKAGLYMNPFAVQFLGYGEAIVNTPSGDNIFGASAPVAPPGATMMPSAPAGMIVPPPQAFVQPAPNMAAVPQAPQMPQVQPHYGVLPQAHQPQQMMAPQAPQMPSAMPQPVQQPAGMPPMPTFNGGQ